MVYVIDGIDCVKAFLDDTGALGKGTFDQHINKLHKVLQQMKDAGLKLKPKKCKWAVKEAKCLEFIAKPLGHVPDLKKIEALIIMNALKSKK